MKKYVILPECDDGNRGDQALVWQTKQIAENAGYIGQYYMLCEANSVMHSKDMNIKAICPVLRHPGRKSKSKDNSKYDIKLLVRWGLVAMGDYLYSKLLLNRVTRPIVKRFLPKDIKKSYDIFEESEAFFVKGGGFIHSYGGITDIYQIYFFMYHIRLALSMKKPVYIMPNSFGPFNAPTVKRQVRKVLSKCQLVCSRESISQKALLDIGVDNVLYPDLAFALNKNEVVIDELAEISKMAGERKLIALTARPYRFNGSENSDERYENYIKTLKKTCDWLYENGFFPVLTEQVISHMKNESDISGIKDISKHLDKQKHYVFSNHKYSCADLKKFYSQMYFTIGTRFHSVIFSLAERVPCIAITYGGNKGQGIMRDLGLSEYAVPIEEVSYEQLIYKIEFLLDNYSSYQEKIDVKMIEFKDKLTELENNIIRKG